MFRKRPLFFPFVAALVGVTLLVRLIAAPPGWWSDPATQILDPNALPNNYAPANLGQLQHTATQAKKHLDQQLATVGGAGPAITNLVAGFQKHTPDNFAPVNLGQLKAVAKPFYDRLIALGVDTKAGLIAHGYPANWAYAYPWSPNDPWNQPAPPGTQVDKTINYAPANLGQLKMSFSFDANQDTDADGIPDWWETLYGLNPHDPADANQTAAGGGMTNAQHFAGGSDPNNPPPAATIVAGTFVDEKDASTSIFPADDSQLLLKNGNFSDPPIAAPKTYDTYSGIPHWTAISGTLVELQKIVTNPGGQYCELDSHWAATTTDHTLPSDHGIQQTVPNLSRGLYILIFDYRARQVAATSTKPAFIAGDFTASVQTAGGTVVPLVTKTAANNNVATTTWKRAFAPFEVKGGNPNDAQVSMTVIFDDAGAADSYGPFIDNVLLLPVEMMVDGNRDGEMSFTDAATHGKDGTTAENPYRFWINNDQDSVGYGSEQEEVPVVDPDHTRTTTRSKRDLEDWARLWISFQGIVEIVKTPGVTLELKFEAMSGNPAIRICQAAEADGGKRYLTDDGKAQEQISGTFKVAHGPITKDAAYTIPSSWLANLNEGYAYKHFLFEGAGEGKGKLQLKIKKGGQVIGQYPELFLDIKDIKRMYERATATPDPIPAPYDSSTPFVDSSADYQRTPIVDGVYQGFDRPPDETEQCLVFVHGWNMSPEEYLNFSETFYKRLWWQGYKGRFVAFRWATLTSPFSYNTSEYRAWKYGESLRKYVDSQKSLLPGYSMNLAAHSMGNIVAGSALKHGMSVDRYLLLEAAIPSGCYNDSVNNFGDFLTAEQNKGVTPYEPADSGYRLYLDRSIFNNQVGKFINFFNVRDFALATGWTFPIGDTNWEQNQIDYKPNTFANGSSYDYSQLRPFGQRSYFNQLLTLSRLVTDPHETMAFVARPHSKAAGAEPKSADVFPNFVDLQADYGFGRERADHSGQFNRPIQQLNGFYKRVFDEVGQ